MSEIILRRPTTVVIVESDNDGDTVIEQKFRRGKTFQVEKVDRDTQDQLDQDEDLFFLVEREERCIWLPARSWRYTTDKAERGPGRLLTAERAWTVLAIGKTKFYELVEARLIEVVRHGGPDGKITVTRKAIRDYIKNHTIPAKATAPAPPALPKGRSLSRGSSRRLRDIAPL